MRDVGEARLAQDVAGPDHPRRDAALEEELLHRGAVDAVASRNGNRIHVVSTLGRGAHAHDLVLVLCEHLVEASEGLLTPLVELGRRSICTLPNAALISDGSKL